MANYYKHAHLYVNGKKVAKCEGGTYTLGSASEPVINDEGVDGHTDAPFTSMISATTVEPLGATGLDMAALMLSRAAVGVAIATWEGKIHQIKNMRVTECELTWDAKAGSLKGSTKISGGEPTVV